MWPQIVVALLGVWLMASPAVLNYAGPAAFNHHVVGPLLASFSCIAAWEVTRPLRWCSFVLSVWLIFSWFFVDSAPRASINGGITGLIAAVLSLQGRVKEDKFAGGWSVLFKRE